MAGSSDKGDHKCGVEGEVPQSLKVQSPKTVFKSHAGAAAIARGSWTPPHTHQCAQEQHSVIPEGFSEAAEASYILSQLPFSVQLNPLFLQTDLCDTS